MPYILIEGYECERCRYRWGSRDGTGYRGDQDPNNCPNCKSPYWNKPRKRKLPAERQATTWEPARSSRRTDPRKKPTSAGHEKQPERKDSQAGMRK